MSLPNLKLISAGAGSGKTYRLTEEMTGLLVSEEARANGIIATTFTKRAAAELRERVRVKLLREGMSREANELKNALIGTVHGLGVKLLRRFAFEAGVSPQVDIIAEEDQQRMFNLAMAQKLDVDRIEEIELLCDKLGLSQNGEKYNWRGEVRRLVEVMRANAFDDATIARSRDNSWTELAKIIPPRNEDLAAKSYVSQLGVWLSEAAAALENNETDSTRATATVVQTLKRLTSQLQRKGYLPWHEIARLTNLKKKGVGAKSRDVEALGSLVDHCQRHATLPAFQDDLKRYIDLLFDSAAMAIREYQDYKAKRGRIDYTDMEVQVLHLLDQPTVQATLRRELDLLMVDEFQDTSPIQLAVFLKLSQLAKRSVWVGDPKQSIYGFRGAEPRLMNAIVAANGPIDPRNIQTKSWRSRSDIVYACNALFTKAFPGIPEEAVVLEPVRTRAGNSFSPPETRVRAEKSGVWHWHFELDGKGRISKGWTMDVLAKALAELLANPPLVLPKGERTERPLRPGDVAVLCRSNYGCVAMAEALQRQGLPAAIARNGLLETAEATLLLACLKYLLNSSDSLSVAEILLFGRRQPLADIVDSRLNYLEALAAYEDRRQLPAWAEDDNFIRLLDQLREETGEYSTSEMLNLLLERLDLRRVIVAWGDGELRLSNVDELRRLAVAYEDNCHRQHRAASLGGFLLYLDGLRRNQTDAQGASERPEAVNVLTYHKSKGLEWPAVVAHNLDQQLRADVFGMAVEAERTEVDLDDVLAGRWLRYWVNPYGKSGGGVDWVAALAESPWQERATENATAEEARLLYVGLTRARDFLILPTNKDGAPWLDRAFARGGGLTPVLDPNSTDAPFDWDGNEVSKLLQTWTEPRSLPGGELRTNPIPFIDGLRRGRAEHAHRFPTDDWKLERYAGVGPGEPHRYFSPAVADPATDVKLYSQAVSSYLGGHTDATPPDDPLALERATLLLRNYLPGGNPDPAELPKQGVAFGDFLTTHWPTATPHRRWPLRYELDGKRIEAALDWLLEVGPDEVVILQDVHQPAKQFDKSAGLHAAHLALLREATERLTGRRVRAAGLHLVAEGLVYLRE